jgi:hypothetical protein
MPEERKPKVDFSHLGGRKIQDFVAEKPEQPIDLSPVGGKMIQGPTEKDAKPVDLSALYGKTGKLVSASVQGDDNA